jgi:hypothetical protein
MTAPFEVKQVAGDPPVLVTQIALCDIGQLLLAHASAVR